MAGSVDQPNVILLVIIVGLVLAMLIVVILLSCSCSSGSRLPMARSKRLLHVSELAQQNQMRTHRRHLKHYTQDAIPLRGFTNIFSRRSLIEQDAIQISPSRPTIFGDGKDTELTVKVVLTPPTPMKGENP